MPDRLCAGGCGRKISATTKSKFAWGHKNGCRTPPPSTPEATSTELAVAAEIEVEIPSVEITLTEPQLNRIWQTLSIHGKGTAIATVLATYE